ncbi:unnamed protein product [Triticum turgidum subsp. durum]|uniref:Uncharacterized protein n=1 Tax=Triticum turgidum subsp. durum TaxID=4567 RepID=A0A9R0RFK6_TRITD|nr:unnamed protein product [Triticum turgidum subsp. durum]
MMMARVSSALFLAMVALVLAVPALAGDPDYLQDICVADLKSGKCSSRSPEFLFKLDRCCASALH